MFEQRRLHPITIILTLGKNIKTLIPAFIYFFVLFLNEPSDSFWIRLSPFLFVGVSLIIMMITTILNWLRYTYRIEDNELRIEHGLFVKKKRYIPFGRIQSLDFSENILHRPFGLVKVKVETAGGGLDEGEAEMTAIKKTDAVELRRIISEAKEKRKLSNEEVAEKKAVFTNEKMLYKISRRQLLFLASTSGRAGIIISAIFAFGGQFQDLLPLDKIFKEMEIIARAGVWIVSTIIIMMLIIAWLISVIWTYLKYNDFTLNLVNNELVITRGLLEKRTTTIPLRRIQAVKITESLFRQPFGYASVSVEYAGNSISDENQMEGMIMPVVKKKDVSRFLKEALPDYTFAVDFIGAPKRAKYRFYFIKTLFATILTCVLSFWLWPYSLLGILLIVGAWILGVLQYRSAGWNITEDQLTLRSRWIQQETFFVKKNRMQSLDLFANWFQERANLRSIATAVMSGGSAGARVRHVEKKDAQTIFEWYRPSEKTNVIRENE